jgi:hypothetical protein
MATTIVDPLSEKNISVIVSKINYPIEIFNERIKLPTKYTIYEIVAKLEDSQNVHIHLHWTLDDPEYQQFPFNPPTGTMGGFCDKNVSTMIDLNMSNQDVNGIVSQFENHLQNSRIRRELSNSMTAAWGMAGSDLSMYDVYRIGRPWCTVIKIDKLKEALNLKFNVK